MIDVSPESAEPAPRQHSPAAMTLTSLVFFAFLVVIDGLVLMLLWNWFVPYWFVGAPRLLAPVAIGVWLLFCFVLNRIPQPQSADEAGQTYFRELVIALFVLAIGFFVKLLWRLE